MGRIRLAWRTCGQAGRMAMELGLHSREMSQQCLENDEQRAAVVDLSCSLVVLDRQLSASAGLPNTFQNTDFDLALGSSVSFDSPMMMILCDTDMGLLRSKHHT